MNCSARLPVATYPHHPEFACRRRLQSVNGWVGAMPNSDEVLHDFIAQREASLPLAVRLPFPDLANGETFYITVMMALSLRMSRAVQAYCVACYAAAWQTYALDARYPRLPQLPWVTVPDDAVPGRVEEGDHVTLVSFPIAAALSVAPLADVLMIARTGMWLEQTYLLLKKRAVACTLDLSGQKRTPLADMLTAIRLAGALSGDGPDCTVENALQVIPEGGIPEHHLDSIAAQCFRTFIGMVENEHCNDLIALAQAARHHFSEIQCTRVRLMTAHTVKGLQVCAFIVPMSFCMLLIYALLFPRTRPGSHRLYYPAESVPSRARPERWADRTQPRATCPVRG